MKYAKIIGTGSYLPEKVLTNYDLEKMVDTSDEWIRTRSGIVTRHIAADNESAATMGAIAGENALQDANIVANEVDLIIVATATPDRMFPSTACRIQDILGCRNAAAFDVSAACTGFIYIMSIADQYIRTGHAKNILIIGTETLSKVVDWQDRSTCVLFGDGAGAMVLSNSEQPGIIDTHLQSIGEYGDILYLPNVAFDIDAEPKKIKMQGREVFRLAVNNFSQLIIETLRKNNTQLAEIDWLVPHQANIRILELLAKKLDLPMDQVVVTLSEQGNTSAATIPLALDVAIRDGRIQRGHLLMLAAFGGGVTLGSALIKY